MNLGCKEKIFFFTYSSEDDPLLPSGAFWLRV
jgi:hypothetical protein